MTLHCHKVDDWVLVEDGMKPEHVPSGWQIAPGDADDIRVCGAHPWQSYGLVFANGDAYGTNKYHFIYPSIYMDDDKRIGEKYDSDRLIQDAQGASAKFVPCFQSESGCDVLLRRRA
jgi:hypothetical protein